MLKTYKLKSPPRGEGSGWAIIVLDTDLAFFSTVSDFGNYVYCWGSGPGMEFRQFLTQVHEDYLGGKLMHGWPNREEYDEEQSRRSVFEALRLMARDAHGNKKRWARYEKERELYRRACKYGGFYDQGDFDDWCRETSIEDAHELRRHALNRQYRSFYKHIWPRFMEMLRHELSAEDVASPVAATET